MMGMCGMGGGIFKMMSLLSMVPATILVTISFFVLLVTRKLADSVLKIFGYVVCGLLWMSALLVFSAGVFSAVSARPQMPCMMGQMMQEGKMPGMMPGMMMENKMEEMQGKNEIMIKGQPAPMGGCMGNPAGKRR
jgi:ABC-type multidrug transport system permease subunit